MADSDKKVVIEKDGMRIIARDPDAARHAQELLAAGEQFALERQIEELLQQRDALERLQFRPVVATPQQRNWYVVAAVGKDKRALYTPSDAVVTPDTLIPSIPFMNTMYQLGGFDQRGLLWRDGEFLNPNDTSIRILADPNQDIGYLLRSFGSGHQTVGVQSSNPQSIYHKTIERADKLPSSEAQAVMEILEASIGSHQREFNKLPPPAVIIDARKSTPRGEANPDGVYLACVRMDPGIKSTDYNS